MENNNFNFNENEDISVKKDLTFDEILGEGKQGKRSKFGGKTGSASASGKKTIIKNVIWICGIVVVSLALAWTGIYAGADYMGIGFGRGQVVEMNIPEGATTAEIAELLEESGAVKMPFLFRVFSKVKGYGAKYKYGLYVFNTEAGYSQLADMLVTQGAKAESVTVTIPEGTGINDYVHIVNGEEVKIKGIATILEEKGVCTYEQLLEAMKQVDFETKLLENCNESKTYYSLEGYLFPDTYQLYAYDSLECAKMVVSKMIAQTDSKITDEMYARAEEIGYTLNEILTMASIIQMEAGTRTEAMADVAAVFYNRLNSDEFATLGSSPTCYYGYSFRKDDQRYDTYKIEGLPPGPLCSPGIAAINAALYPSENSYYYFVTDTDGKFYFHKTLSEQNATIARLKNEGKWAYETFK